MHYFAVNSILAGITSIFLGNFVYSRNPKDRLTRVFLMFTVVAAYFAFTEALMRMAANQNAANLWMKLGAFWPFTLALTAHFTLIYTENTELLRNRLIQLLIYGSALLISLLGLTTDLLTTKPVMAYWGCWTQTIPEKSSILVLPTIWLGCISILMLYMIVSYYLKSTKEKKKQAKYVMIGISLPMLMGMITEGILPSLGIEFPELTTTGFIIGAVFLAYAIWKLKLFALTPATAAESIIHAMVDSLFLVDTEGKIVMVNQAALQLLGYKQRELVNQPWEIILTGERNFELKETWIKQLIKKDVVSNTETTFKTKDGREISISLSTAAIQDEDGIKRGMVFVGRDLTEYKEYEKQLAYLAAHDSLTGMPNRRSLEEVLRRAIARAKRGAKGALLFLDADYFKFINDKYGHMVGDKVLVGLARSLRKALRDGDFLARTGGDEFAIVLEQTDIGEAHAIAERVRKAVEEEVFVVNANRFQLGVSVGVALIDERQGFSLLMSQADKAMYEAKKKGRNRVEFPQGRVRDADKTRK